MNEHHRTLLDDLDEVPVGAAPVGHLVSGGRAVKRRKQRAFVAGAAAVTALVVGGSAVALQGIPGGSDDRDGNDPLIADSAAPDLAVEVEVGVSKPLAALIDGQDGKVSIWNPGHRTLAFVPAMGYSSSCPPLGTATLTESGVVTLTVRDDPEPPTSCQLDLRSVTVIIDGLTAAPSELTVTVSGETDTIPVKSLAEGQAPYARDVLPFEADRLDCAMGDATSWTYDLAEPPPGVTIEEALLRHGDEGAVVQERTHNRAVATVEDNGRVIKTLVLTTWSKSNDSWFVESGATCRR